MQATSEHGQAGPTGRSLATGRSANEQQDWRRASPTLAWSAEDCLAAAPGVRDFICDYADYADVLEAPRESHEAVAISLLAATLNPRVKIEHGAQLLSLDLWTLILSGSGLGRNTLVSLAYPVLDASGQSALIRGATWGSGPALYQDLAQNPRVCSSGRKLSQMLQDPQAAPVHRSKGVADGTGSTALTCRMAFRYRATGQPNNTPPILFSEAPR